MFFAFCLGFALSAGAQPDLAQVEALVVQLTNDFRREQGLAPVAPEAKLGGTAQRFAEYMARTGRYGHDADGRTPAARAEQRGYRYCSVSENISYQFDSADFATRPLAVRLVEGWKASPGHRQNMVAPHVLHTGVAVARAANGYYYAVQLFARPESASVAFEVKNAAGTSVGYRVGEERFTLPRNTAHTHTRCTPEPLVLEEGNGVRPRGAPLTPRDGERLSVVREGNYVSLRR